MKRAHFFAFLTVALFASTAVAQTAAPAKPAKPSPADTVPTTEPVDRDIKQHQAINERAKQGDVDLLFLGDSITYGWQGNGAEAWAKYFAPRKAMNAGIGGDRTQHILWRLDHGNIDGLSPKLAVMMIGTNNSGVNTSQQIADGVKAIVEKLRKKLPNTKILLLAIFPRGADKNDERRKVNEGANAEIAKLADDKMVYYLDIGSKFMNPDGTISTDIMYDLLHLTPKGYEIEAEAIDGKVAELMGEKK